MTSFSAANGTSVQLSQTVNTSRHLRSASGNGLNASQSEDETAPTGGNSQGRFESRSVTMETGTKGRSGFIYPRQLDPNRLRKGKNSSVPSSPFGFGSSLKSPLRSSSDTSPSLKGKGTVLSGKSPARNQRIVQSVPASPSGHKKSYDASSTLDGSPLIRRLEAPLPSHIEAFFECVLSAEAYQIQACLNSYNFSDETLRLAFFLSAALGNFGISMMIKEQLGVKITSDMHFLIASFLLEKRNPNSKELSHIAWILPSLEERDLSLLLLEAVHRNMHQLVEEIMGKILGIENYSMELLLQSALQKAKEKNYLNILSHLEKYTFKKEGAKEESKGEIIPKNSAKSRTNAHHRSNSHVRIRSPKAREPALLLSPQKKIQFFLNVISAEATRISGSIQGHEIDDVSLRIAFWLGAKQGNQDALNALKKGKPNSDIWYFVASLMISWEANEDLGLMIFSTAIEKMAPKDVPLLILLLTQSAIENKERLAQELVAKIGKLGVGTHKRLLEIAFGKAFSKSTTPIIDVFLQSKLFSQMFISQFLGMEVFDGEAMRLIAKYSSQKEVDRYLLQTEDHELAEILRPFASKLGIAAEKIKLKSRANFNTPTLQTQSPQKSPKSPLTIDTVPEDQKEN